MGRILNCSRKGQSLGQSWEDLGGGQEEEQSMGFQLCQLPSLELGLYALWPLGGSEDLNRGKAILAVLFS